MKKLKRYQYERYAVLCSLAYQKVFKQTRYGFAPNGQRVIANRFGKTMMRVLWSNDSDEVIVVIKGSHNIADWLLNLRIWQVRGLKHLDYPFHAGYAYQLQQNSPAIHKKDEYHSSVYQRLISILTPLILQGKRVSFTGHSCGGAIGTVLADAIERQFPKSIKRVVTFGQPAIGGKAFRNCYLLHHRTYRICCDLDIVTFLPPIPYFYQHVGKMLWLYNGRIYENTPTVLRLVQSLGSWLLRPFSYHLMRKYIRNKDFFDER
ncbi:lipase family protein [Vibrio rhodolitus]|uniref:lipase family protein n=1 Tax=Vibrio rhodolitus TaxID=2231649 RepID=UPI000E09EBE8|nr:lipase [Vibrio rhodolitus]